VQSCHELLQGLQGLPQLLDKLSAAIVRCEQHVSTSTSTSTSGTETEPGALEPPPTPPTPPQRDTEEDRLAATTAAGIAESTSNARWTGTSQALPAASRARIPPRLSLPQQQQPSSSLPTSVTLPPFDHHFTPFKSVPSFEDLAASVACERHQHTRSTRSTPSSSLSSSLSSSPSNPSVLAMAAAAAPHTAPSLQLHRSWTRAPPASGSPVAVQLVGSPGKHVHWAPQLTHTQQI
jgi:hypothetical protein